MRKIVALFVALLILTACTTLAFAEEKLVEVSYTKPATYELIIPDRLPVSGGLTNSFELGLGASNVGVSIQIQSVNGMQLSSSRGSISYSIVDLDDNRTVPNNEWFTFYENNSRAMQVVVDDTNAIPGVTYTDSLKFVVSCFAP